MTLDRVGGHDQARIRFSKQRADLVFLLFIDISKADSETQSGKVMSHDPSQFKPDTLGHPELEKQSFTYDHLNNGVHITAA